MASSYQAGIQPAFFLTHSFLQDHPILLEEGYLMVNWDRIPGLYSRTDKLLMVSITDAQWEKWGQPGGWTAWEPDTRADNFIPNMAVVVCKGIFHDALDPQLQDKVSHFMTIARVPDCIKLLPFDQLREAFNNYNKVATAIRLVWLHRSNVVFPDVYFQFYGEHFTIMGLLDPEIQFGTADEFVGGLPGVPACSVQWPESPRHAPSKLHAGGQMPQALPYVHLPAGRYQNSGTAPTHSCHIHGCNREVLTESQQVLYCRSPSQGVVI